MTTDYRRQLVADHRELAIKTQKDLEEQYFPLLEMEARLRPIINRQYDYTVDLCELYDTYAMSSRLSGWISALAGDDGGDTYDTVMRLFLHTGELPANLHVKTRIAVRRLWLLYRMFDRIQAEIAHIEEWRTMAQDRIRVLDKLADRSAQQLSLA